MLPWDYVNWIFLSSESLVYRESDLINDEVRKKSPFYQQYLKVFDLVNIAGMVIARRRSVCRRCYIVPKREKMAISLMRICMY
jgi:hypothetical protein